MQIDVTVTLNLVTGKVGKAVYDATAAGLRDTMVKIAAEVVRESPIITGNNKRSIQYTAKDLQASVFSTSGYGGFLETGTRFMAAQPYFRPALDHNIGGLTNAIKRRLGA